MTFDYLPSGESFLFWDCDTVFTKIYYVDTQNPLASDDNDGTEQRPFKTIDRAASLVQPCEKIIVKEGVYHETIRDINGGEDAAHMVSIEGEGDVVITGAVKWDCEFERSAGLRETSINEELELFSLDDSIYYANNGAEVYMGEIPAHVFSDGYNPFSIMNLPSTSWVPKKNSYPRVFNNNIIENLGVKFVDNIDIQLIKRGLLFCDGERLEQVLRPFELWERDGVYWVEDGGRRIHLRLKKDDDPKNYSFELAVLEQGFAPKKSGLSYIRLKNLNFEKFSNPFVNPQKGAVSTNCGHHFIIENCSVDQVNAAGIDLGFISHLYLHKGIRGHHIVRNNTISNCGISAICAVPTCGRFLENMLIENNIFQGNCWQPVEVLLESAVIKNHFTKDSLYRNNIFIDTQYGCGIWLDKCNNNSRICNNIFIGIKSTGYGAIFNEATFYPTMTDHNLIYDSNGHESRSSDGRSGGHGIHTYEVDCMTVSNNLIFNTEGDGVHCAYKKPEYARLIGLEDKRTAFARDNKILNNLIHNCRHAVSLPAKNNFSDFNIVGNMRLSHFYIEENGEQHNLKSWRKYYGFDEKGKTAKVEIDFNKESLLIKIQLDNNYFVLDLKNTHAIEKFWSEYCMHI